MPRRRRLMTPERVDRIDSETTRAWMNHQRFSESLARDDMALDEHDGVTRTDEERAARWSWEIEHVRSFIGRPSGGTR